MNRRSLIMPSLLAAMPALFVLALHARLYYPFIADDAFISLRYAERFAQGLGLTWNDGERVEGYSNLLWVLANALLYSSGVDLVTACRALGALGMGGVLVCVARCSTRDPLRMRAAGALAALCLALTGPLAAWAVGGLEQALLALLLAWALIAADTLIVAPHEAKRWSAAVPLAALCLTRPDSPVLVLGVLLGVWGALGPRGLKHALVIGLWAAAAVVTQLIFRLAYYGEWVPNSARAKVAFTAERIVTGVIYVFDALLHLWPLYVLALLLTVMSRQRRARLLPALGVLLLWSVYVLVIGGDIFPARRHSVPLLVALGMVLAIGLRQAFESKRAYAFTVALSVLAMVAQIGLTARDPQNFLASTERWELDGEVIGRLLGRAFVAEQPLLAVDAAGCLPYYSRLPAIDMLGINDKYLAAHPPPGFGHGRLGHELGNGAYVMSRAPDLVLPCLSQGADHGCYRSGRELLARADFRQHYRLLNFEGSEPYRFRSRIFVRTDGRLGIRSSASGMTIPGVFFAFGRASATLDAQGRIGTTLEPGQAVGLQVTAEDGRRWKAHTELSGTAKVGVEDRQITLTAGPAGAHIRALVLSLGP